MILKITLKQTLHIYVDQYFLLCAVLNLHLQHGKSMKNTVLFIYSKVQFCFFKSIKALSIRI